MLMPETLELTERQRGLVIDRLAKQVERITRSGLTEEQKLLAIGKQVAGDIADLTDPLYGMSDLPVEPSILPKHDDATIDNLARWQRTMRKANVPAAVQAETMDKLERLELQMQRDERTPAPRSQFDFDPDEGPHVSYHFDS